MKIAVTGGSGFIGAPTVVAARKAGHQAWSVDRTHGGDVLGHLGGLEGANAVIHLAGVLGTAELFDTPNEAVEVNVLGALNVMQWCIRNGARYIGILMPDVFPSLYTATKIASQRIATALHHNRGLQVAHVRAFNAYGPGQKHGPGHPQKILPTFAVKAWRQEPIPIWGSGRQTVDMIHVDDLARMLVDAIDHCDADRVFDGGTGVPMTVEQVAQVAARAAGWEHPVFEFLPMRQGEIESEIHAAGEGWDLLGWRPRYDLDLMREAVLTYRNEALG